MDNKRKTFYSMTRKKGITGVVLRDGYEVLAGGLTFHAYSNSVDGNIYMIDPDTGIAVSSYRYIGMSIGDLSESELIEMAKEDLMESRNLEKWLEGRAKKSYHLAVRAFQAYRRAERLRERQLAMARLEKGNDREG